MIRGAHLCSLPVSKVCVPRIVGIIGQFSCAAQSTSILKQSINTVLCFLVCKVLQLLTQVKFKRNSRIKSVCLGKQGIHVRLNFSQVLSTCSRTSKVNSRLSNVCLHSVHLCKVFVNTSKLTCNKLILTFTVRNSILLQEFKVYIVFSSTCVQLRHMLISTIKLTLYVLLSILNAVYNLSVLDRVFLKQSFLIPTVINNLFSRKIGIVTKLLKAFCYSFTESLTSLLIRLRKILLKLLLTLLNVFTLCLCKPSKLGSVLLLGSFKLLDVRILCFLCGKQSILGRRTCTSSSQLILCPTQSVDNRITSTSKRFFRSSYSLLRFYTNSIAHDAFTLRDLSEGVNLS